MTPPIKNKSIHIIITGGTIDSIYDGTKDTAVPLKESILPDYFKLLRLYEKVTFQTICMKDSRSITPSDRRKMLAAIKKSKAKNILMTHGTYTMPDTGRFLENQLDKNDKNDKKVILTGSMIPLVGFSPSDAGFNLGFAIGQFDHIDPGVYVAMNGKIFSSNEVIKLVSQGRFSSILNK